MKLNEKTKRGMIAVMSAIVSVLATLAFLEWNADRKNRAQLVKIAQVEMERRNRMEVALNEDRARTEAVRRAGIDGAVSRLTQAIEPCSSTADLKRIHEALERYTEELPLSSDDAPVTWSRARETASALSLFLRVGGSDEELASVVKRVIEIKAALTQKQ